MINLGRLIVLKYLIFLISFPILVLLCRVIIFLIIWTLRWLFHVLVFQFFFYHWVHCKLIRSVFYVLVCGFQPIKRLLTNSFLLWLLHNKMFFRQILYTSCVHCFIISFMQISKNHSVVVRALAELLLRFFLYIPYTYIFSIKIKQIK